MEPVQEHQFGVCTQIRHQAFPGGQVLLLTPPEVVAHPESLSNGRMGILRPIDVAVMSKSCGRRDAKGGAYALLRADESIGNRVYY